MLDVRKITEVVTTLGEAAKRGLFIHSEDWAQRAVERPDGKYYAYVYHEDADDPFGALVYGIDGEPATFMTVQEMCDQDYTTLGFAKVWVF